MPFRIQSKSLLLTYTHSHAVSRADLLAFLSSVRDVEAYVIGQESHEGRTCFSSKFLYLLLLN